MNNGKWRQLESEMNVHDACYEVARKKGRAEDESMKLAANIVEVFARDYRTNRNRLEAYFSETVEFFREYLDSEDE